MPAIFCILCRKHGEQILSSSQIGTSDNLCASVQTSSSERERLLA